MTALDQALHYASLGLPIFPVIPKSKVPGTKTGFKAATTDPAKIREWWDQRDYGVGCAIPEGVIVVDFDAGAHEHLKEIEEIPETWTAQTPGKGGGRHYWFRIPDGYGSISPKVNVMEGVDIRTFGSYVVMPPSQHPDGGFYVWEEEPAGEAHDLPFCPKWIMESILTPHYDKEKDKVDLIQYMQGIPTGARQVGLFRVACYLRSKDLDKSIAEIILEEIARKSEGSGYKKWPDIKALVKRVWDRYEANRVRDHRIWTADELLAEDFGQIDWIVDDLLSHGVALVYADEKVGKCQKVGTQVLDSTGVYRNIEDIKPLDRVISLDTYTGNQVIGTVVASESAGKKRCVRLTTNLGSVIELSNDHPVLNGDLVWSPAGEVRVGDKLATVRILQETDTHDLGMSVKEAKLLGYLTGDGEIGNGINFTNSDRAIRRDFLRLLKSEYPDCKWSIAKEANGCVTYRIAGKNREVGNQLLSRLRELGLYGKKSGDKFIPEHILRASNLVAGAYLNAIFSCDGHIRKNKNGSYTMEYATNSQQLSKQLKVLLAKFGVVSRLTKRKSNFDTTYYRLDITSSDSVYRFCTSVGFTGDKEKVYKKSNRPKSVSKLDVIPHSFWVKAESEGADLCRVGTGGEHTAGGINRDLAKSIAMSVGSRRLSALSSDSIYWDKVVSVEDVGECETWDLQIDKYESFVAEGVFVHNSMLVANLAYSIATRRKAWDYFVVPKARGVLYLDLEQDKMFGRERWRKIFDGAQPPQNLRIAFSWERMDAGGLEDIKYALQSNRDIEVVVIDILSEFLPLTPQPGMNAYHMEIELMKKLKRVADQYRCLFILVHHTNKDGDASGTRAMKGAPHYLFDLSREQRSTVAHMEVKGKNIEASKLLMSVEMGKLHWRVEGRE